MPSHPDRVRRNYEEEEFWDGRPETLNAALYRDGCGAKPADDKLIGVISRTAFDFYRNRFPMK